MSVKMRQEVERKISQAVIDSAIKAGYAVTVDNGEEEVLKNSTNSAAIIRAMFTTDDEWLHILRDGKKVGWVRLIYGNDGYDVVSDYTTNLEPIMAEADKLADYYGG